MTLFQALLAISAVLVLTLLYLLSTFNHLIRLRNRVRTDFSDIDIQLRRRASLIQNLVDMVREYTKHESKTFKEVAAARTALDNSRTATQTAQANNMLSETLRSLLMVTEDYPELKATENYQQLRQDLLSTENSLAQYREEYNQTVERYNNTIQTFPNLLVAGLFGFENSDLFQESEGSAFSVAKEA